MTTTKTIDYALDCDLAEKSPFHAAVLWYRLGSAISAIQGAVGTLDHPLIEQVDSLRDKAWDLLWTNSATDDARDEHLARARRYVKENG